MIEGIPWPIISDIGSPGLVVLIVLMILTDRLVTRSRLEEMRKAKDHWKTAFEREQETNRIHARAADARTIVDETVVRVMSSIQEQSPGGDG